MRSVLPMYERDVLVELAKDKSIVISKADKGNVMVVQDIADYKQKIRGILATSGKFKLLKNNVTRIRETRLQNYLRSLRAEKDKKKVLRENRIETCVYNKVLPCCSRAGFIGLPKIHKPNAPLRPIISAVKTYNYALAKHLNEILTPLVDTSFMLRDTYDFVNKVSTLDQHSDRYNVSFDVESLFTNVPTLETIDILLDLAFKEEARFFHNFSRVELKKLLIVCTLSV